MIWNYTLISPTIRWDTRHHASCKYRDRSAVSEVPAFITINKNGCFCGECLFCRKYSYTDRDRELPPLACACTCARTHRGLNLLQTNRQIFSEAAHIFYANNTLCFDNGYMARGCLTFLRPQFQDMIRSISLLGAAFGQDLLLKKKVFEKLWSPGLGCTGFLHRSSNTGAQA